MSESESSESTQALAAVAAGFLLTKSSESLPEEIHFFEGFRGSPVDYLVGFLLSDSEDELLFDVLGAIFLTRDFLSFLSLPELELMATFMFGLVALGGGLSESDEDGCFKPLFYAGFGFRFDELSESLEIGIFFYAAVTGFGTTCLLSSSLLLQ